jgi:hydroxymethylbilane synthase
VSLSLAVSSALQDEATLILEAMRGSGFTVELARLEHPDSEDPTTEVLEGGARLALVPAESLHPLPPGLSWAAVPKRSDPRDVLVPAGGDSATLVSLAPGTRVGVAGARRWSLLRAHRPDVEAVALLNGGGPGAALSSDAVDAAIVGAAEARRGLSEWRATEILDPKAWIPGACQGAAVLVSRDEDDDARLAASSMEHADSRATLLAEASVMDALGLTCAAPMGVSALSHGRRIRIWAMLVSSDGRKVIRGDITGMRDSPEAAGRALADILRARGGTDILEGSGA